MELSSTSLSTHRPAPRNERAGWWLSLFVLCAILGAMMGLSVKTQNIVRRQTQAAAGAGYQVLNKQVSDQQRTITALQQNIAKLENDLASGTSRAQALGEDLKKAKFLAGLTDVQGPGILVTLNDSKNRIPGAPAAAIMPGLIHDTDINQTVNELKAAGAEAIAVNNQRLVAISPIRCAGPTIYVNNTPQTPAYVIRAIGDPATLQNALNLPGGVADQLRQIDPSMIQLHKVARVVVPAFSGATQPRYAVPVSAPGAAKAAG